MSREPVVTEFKIPTWGKGGCLKWEKGMCNEEYYGSIKSLHDRVRRSAVQSHWECQNTLFGPEEPSQEKVTHCFFVANEARALLTAGDEILKKGSDMFKGLKGSKFTYGEAAQTWIASANTLPEPESIQFGATVYAPISRKDPRWILSESCGGYKKLEWQVDPSTGTRRSWSRKPGSEKSTR